uniref:Uncharacterized protein n=1 Tax=Sphaerodactylus townsendi TaxID=933632 RepID=A0ACB8F0H4_9SAUR
MWLKARLQTQTLPFPYQGPPVAAPAVAVQLTASQRAASEGCRNQPQSALVSSAVILTTMGREDGSLELLESKASATRTVRTTRRTTSRSSKPKISPFLTSG